GDAEDEAEHRVADRDDAAGGIEPWGDPVTGRVVDAVRPGGDRPAEQPDRRRRRGADDGQLGGQPAGAGDRLVPGQPVGAGLELAGDQWGTPEDADQGGHPVHGSYGQAVRGAVAAALRVAEEVFY